MKTLIEQVQDLKNSDIKIIIDKKIKDFSDFKNKEEIDWFSELCFCLLTANFQAKKSIEIQKVLIENNGFLDFNQEELSTELKNLGHRFYNKRAEYIILARKYQKVLKETLNNLENDKEKRNWLFENIKGIGLKEASHFLRNTGHNNLAILDFHIIDILVEKKLIEKPKTLTKNKYEEIEETLENICKQTGLQQGELDFYLWFLETGEILK